MTLYHVTLRLNGGVVTLSGTDKEIVNRDAGNVLAEFLRDNAVPPGLFAVDRAWEVGV